MSVTRPTNLAVPFATSGAKNTIPVADASPLASYNLGFPPVNMMPIVAGGVPPEGKDFNGVLYDITSHTVWVNAGGQYQFDATLSSLIGGYPVGMVLQNTGGTASYVNVLAGNTTDFNSTPAAIGVSWVPYAGAAFSNVAIATTGGTTVLTAIQAAATLITVTGALVSNAILTLPAALGRWTVINNTTGAYSLTVIALAGAGVPILQGGADTVICDATNVRYGRSSCLTQALGDASLAEANTLFVARAVGAVGGFYQDTGALNAVVVTTIPATGAYFNGMSLRTRIAVTNTGAMTMNAGAGVVPLVKESGAAMQAGDAPITSIVSCTYISASSSFVVNEVVASDFLDSPAFRNTPTAPTAAPGTNTTQLATTEFATTATSNVSYSNGLYMLGILF